MAGSDKHSEGADPIKRIAVKINSDRLRASVRVPRNAEAPALTEGDLRKALKAAGVISPEDVMSLSEWLEQ